jgi:hypothetical protein
MGAKEMKSEAATSTLSRGSKALEFKPVSTAGSNVTFVRAASLEKGAVAAEGIYAGSSPNTFNKEKLDYRIEDLKDSSKLTVVNGAGNLGYQMQSVQPGDIVRITYNGKTKITKGPMIGKESHSFIVEKA